MAPWLHVLFAVALLSGGSCAATGAQTIADKGAQMSKVSPELATLYDEYSSFLAARGGGTFQPSSPLVRVIDGRVVVDAVASGDANILKADLEALGTQKAVAFGRVVSGELPIVAIPRLEGVPSLNFARAATATLQRGPRTVPQGGTPGR